ncbi:MAG: aspartate aminotransferase family protein [Myxococcales bacterium]|nr:aspartate aminotransferase family protein [Myxococcales bacterium]
MRTLPLTGRPHDELLGELKALGAADVNWRDGRVFSLVYHAGDAHSAFLKQAHNLFFSENALNPMAFASLRRMESDVVRMAANLFHGDDNVVGTMTSGGTESLLLAVKAARERARKHSPWIRRPEMVVPTTAHVAFDKAGYYFGVRVRRVAVDGTDFRADVRAMTRAINARTILLVASAPQYAHGVVDPIAELSDVALAHKLPLHVDACVGGFILPFLERLGHAVPRWDFRVPGVTSISADLHKYGYTAKGASTLLFRDMSYLRHQFFVSVDNPSGVYASPGVAGTRGGGAIAAAWAGLQAMGEEGYLRHAKLALDAATALRRGLGEIAGIALCGAPHATIVTWRSTDPALDLFAVADQLQAKGWYVDRQQHPTSIHLTVTSNHAAIVEDYLRDAREAVAHVRAHPELKSEGSAAMYGMMAKVPARFLVKDAVLKALEGMYSSTSKAPDMASPGDGAVDRFLNRHRAKVGEVLDGLEQLRAKVAIARNPRRWFRGEP